MTNKVLEGVVIEPGDEWDFTDQVEAFQQRMDEMKEAYMVAATLITQGAPWPPQEPPKPKEPKMSHMVIRACGKVLVAVGSWMVDQFEVNEVPESGEEAERTKSPSGDVFFKAAPRLPLPDWETQGDQ